MAPGAPAPPAIWGSAGSRPDRQRKAGILGWARDPVLLVSRPSALSPGGSGSRKGPRYWGGSGGWGALISFRSGGRSLSSLAKHSGALRPRGDWQVCGGGVPGAQPHPPTLCLPRLRGADPGPGRFVPLRARSRRCPTKLSLCPAASAGPADVSVRDQPGGAGHGLRRPLAAKRRQSSPPGPAQQSPFP